MATADLSVLAAAEAHQQGQDALASLIPDVLRQAWPLLDVHDIRGTLPRFTVAVKAIVERYGLASATAALEHYQSQRAAAGVAGSPVRTLAPSATSDVIEAALGWAVSDLYGPTSVESITAAQDKVAEAVVQLVLDRGRDTIIGATRRDKQAKGWVRVTEPNACSFCTMLALRGGAGMLYRTQGSAGRLSDKRFTGDGQFKVHNNCRCHAEPVFNAYEPSARMREAQRIWNESTKGKSGNAARIAFRQALEGRYAPETPRT